MDTAYLHASKENLAKYRIQLRAYHDFQRRTSLPTLQFSFHSLLRIVQVCRRTRLGHIEFFHEDRNDLLVGKCFVLLVQSSSHDLLSTFLDLTISLDLDIDTFSCLSRRNNCSALILEEEPRIGDSLFCNLLCSTLK